MSGRIRLEDASEEYDWIRCFSCRKSFPKREYLSHRREHRKIQISNALRTAAGDSVIRLITPARKSPVPVVLAPSNNRTAATAENRIIPVVTLSSDDDEDHRDDGVLGSGGGTSDSFLGSSTEQLSRPETPIYTVEDDDDDEVEEDDEILSYSPVSVGSESGDVDREGIIRRRSLECPPHCSGSEPSGSNPGCSKQAGSGAKKLLEHESPAGTFGGTTEAFRDMSYHNRPTVIRESKRLTEDDRTKASPAALGILLTCHECIEHFYTEEDLDCHRKKYHSDETSSEAGSIASTETVLITRKRPAAVAVEDNTGPSVVSEKKRLVVVLRRLEQPTRGKGPKFKCVRRDETSGEPSMPKRKRKRRQEIQLNPDIQPYVRRAAASKPINYGENSCPYCHENFSSYKAVEAHIKKHEDPTVAAEATLPSLPKSSVPIQIGKVLTSSSTENVESIEQPPRSPILFSNPVNRRECKYCHGWFTDAQMTRHMNFHAKKKRYKCTNCQKMFGSFSGKRAHEQKCRQYSLVFLPNGEWRRVPMKAKPVGPVVTRTGPSNVPVEPIPVKLKKNLSKRRGQRKLSRNNSTKGSLPRSRSTPTVKTSEVPSNNEQTSKSSSSNEKTESEKVARENPQKTLQSGLQPQKRSCSDPIAPSSSPKLAKCDLKADYNSSVGKRILNLLNHLDKAATVLKQKRSQPTSTSKSGELTAATSKNQGQESTVAGIGTSKQSCWVVKLYAKKSISCSLFTRNSEVVVNTAETKGQTPAQASSPEKPLDCDFCQTKLSPANYLHHVLQHEECSAYTCPFCLKIYLHSGLFNNHMKLVHSVEAKGQEDSSNTRKTNANSVITGGKSTESVPTIVNLTAQMHPANNSKDFQSTCASGSQRCKNFVSSQNQHWKKTFVRLSCNN